MRSARRRGDSGVAIVAAMAVVMLVGVLVAVIVGIAISEAKQTGHDRQASSGVATAEGRVDTVTAELESATPQDLQSICGSTPGSTTVGADDFGMTTNVTFYSAAGAVVGGTDAVTGVTEPCSNVVTTPVAEAKVTVHAVSQGTAEGMPATRTVSSLVKLTPTYAVGLDKALFSNSDMTMANNTVLTSASGKPDADIYTNGDFHCRNNEEFHGSILAQGSIYLESQCTVLVDAWAKGQVSVTNPSASIGGRALSATSTVSLDKAALGQQARAAGLVTGNACNTAGKCFSNVSVDAPPTLDFPQLVWDSAAQQSWAANGYTNIVTIDSSSSWGCGWYNGPNVVGMDGKSVSLNGKATGPGAWLYANAWQLPSDTILAVNCPNQALTLQGINLTLNHNLVIVSTGGITFSNQTTISSVTGTATPANPNLLYLIQPYSYMGTPIVCNGGYGIQLDNQVTVTNTVNTLLYSPCSIRKANKAQIVGQVYSGSVLEVDNQLDMSYVPLPVWGGIANNSQAVTSYSVDVLYKREGN